MPAEGVGVYLQGAWANYGGTSWSAPEFAAELAEIYQYCKTAFANPVALPYTVYGRNSSDFLAITSGTNYYPPVVSSPAYAANGHYSDATGLGVPYGMPFAQTLCPNRVPSGAPAALIGVAPTPAPAQSVVVNAQPLTSSIGSDFGPKAASDQVRVQLVLRPTTTIATDEQTVIGTLESAGFTLVQTFPNNLVVDVSATTATVNTFFATTIHNVNQPTAGLRFSPSGTFTIPASLAPYVASASLDNLVRAFTGPLTH
jgi:subtilase family serine protease